MDTMEDSGSKQAFDKLIQRWEREQIAMAYGGVPNHKVYKEILKCQEQGVMSNALAEMFLSISKQIADKLNLPEGFKDDTVCNGVAQACYQWEKFDSSKTTNALGYMIQVIKSGHIQYVHNERKHENTYITL